MWRPFGTGFLVVQKNRVYTQHLFTPFLTPLCFKAPCQFTPLLNLLYLVFRLTPVGCLRFIRLTPYF